MVTGDAYPLPRPALYDTELDEANAAALSAYDTARAAIVAEYRGAPTGKHVCRILDRLAADLIAANTEDDDSGE